MESVFLMHAYLIMAHKVDKTLNTLLSLVDDPRNDIFLHMDRKNSSFKRSDLVPLKYSRIEIISEVSVNWGGYSQIECEMALFEAASKKGRYNYYHLMSGQDLPLKSQGRIHNFFDSSDGKLFIECQSNPKLIEKRVRYYHLLQEKAGRRGVHPVIDLAEKMLLSLQKIFFIRRNRNIIFDVGSNWVSVTDDFVRALVAHKDWVRNVFKYTLCADEIFIHTFAVNFGFRDRLCVPHVKDGNESVFRLIDWKRGAPYVWRMEDADTFSRSEMMFARKFDAQTDAQIIDYVISMVSGSDT